MKSVQLVFSILILCCFKIDRPYTKETFIERVVAQQLSDPWEIVYGPDGYLWVTEARGYQVSRIEPHTGKKKVVLDLNDERHFPRYDLVPDSIDGGKKWPQSGLMGMALHPDFLKGKPYVYLAFIYYFSGADQQGDGCALDLKGCFYKTKIVRYLYDHVLQKLDQATVIDDDIPGSNDHNGGRLLIAPIKNSYFLFYSIGDMGAGQFDNGGRKNHAQDKIIKEGKILRYNIEPDEDTKEQAKWIPNDNPFNNDEQSAVWTIGHRNPEGLCYAAFKGKTHIFSCEHGPFSDDEINLIEGGGNYGHPLIIGYNDGNYNGMAAAASDHQFLPGHWHTTYPFIKTEQTNASMLGKTYHNPLYVFNATDGEELRDILESIRSSSKPNLEWKSVAPSSIAAYTSDGIPGWKNSLLITTLKAGELIRLKLGRDGGQVEGKPIYYFKGNLRYRDLALSPDGTKIYLITDSSAVTSGPSGEDPEKISRRGSILEFTYRQ